MVNENITLELDDDSNVNVETLQQDSISADVSELVNVDVVISESESIALSITEQRASAPTYTGAYTFTPTEETQTVNIAGMMATQNITVNPIPNNYGLITWNGSVLTVS